MPEVSVLAETTFTMEIINKIKEKYKLDVNRVVDEYDQYLRLALITTTPFQDIVNRKLSPRNRLFQRLLFLHYVYLIPRYAFLCLLYLKNEDTQKYYQQLLGDYGEEFGLLGRTFNICYVVFSIEIVINVIVMRRHEENASVEFLTDWLTRVPQTVDNQDRTVENKPASVDLDNDMKHQLISQLHYKMVFAKQISRSTNQSLLLYDLTACGLFFYRRKPSLVSTCLTLYNWVACVIGIQIAGNHFYSLYLSFVVTADYFKIGIKRIMTRIDSIQKNRMTNKNLTEILNDYDQLLTVFNKLNKLLKHLLRNMVDFYAVGLTFAFFMYTIRTDLWMVGIMFMCAAGYAFTILVTGFTLVKSTL